MAIDEQTFGLLLEAVARFVRDRLVPLETEVAQTNALPATLIQEMRDLGLFELSIPERFGGMGLGMEEEVRVVFELGQTSTAQPPSPVAKSVTKLPVDCALDCDPILGHLARRDARAAGPLSAAAGQWGAGRFLRAD